MKHLTYDALTLIVKNIPLKDRILFFKQNFDQIPNLFFKEYYKYIFIDISKKSSEELGDIIDNLNEEHLNVLFDDEIVRFLYSIKDCLNKKMLKNKNFIVMVNPAKLSLVPQNNNNTPKTLWNFTIDRHSEYHFSFMNLIILKDVVPTNWSEFIANVSMLDESIYSK